MTSKTYELSGRVRVVSKKRNVWVFIPTEDFKTAWAPDPEGEFETIADEDSRDLLIKLVYTTAADVHFQERINADKALREKIGSTAWRVEIENWKVYVKEVVSP